MKIKHIGLAALLAIYSVQCNSNQEEWTLKEESHKNHITIEQELDMIAQGEIDTLWIDDDRHDIGKDRIIYQSKYVIGAKDGKLYITANIPIVIK